jgi:hypothetical protein
MLLISLIIIFYQIWKMHFCINLSFLTYKSEKFNTGSVAVMVGRKQMEQNPDSRRMQIS